MGRPARILTVAELTKFEADARALDDVADVLKYLDVSRSTYNRWMKYGAEHPDDVGDFRREFWRIVQNARLGSKRTLLGVVTDIAINGETEATRLSAAKYLLDRVHKLAMNVALSNPDGSALGTPRDETTMDLDRLTTDQLETYHALLAAARVNPGGQDEATSETPAESGDHDTIEGTITP